MKNKGFTLVELLSVIIVIALIMTLIVPNILKDLNTAQDEALISYANKVRKSANEYAITHRNEIDVGIVKKNISDIMSDTGKYTGSIYIYSDGSSYINNISVDGQKRKLCNIDKDETITESKILYDDTSCYDGLVSTNSKDSALLAFANEVREQAKDYKVANADESSDNEFVLVANISDIINNTGNYYGYVSIREDGSTYINYIGETNEQRILCNVDSNQILNTNLIEHSSFCIDTGLGAK